MSGNNYLASRIACIEELIAVLRRHGFNLGHEDSQGGFLLHPRGDGERDAEFEEWLRAAELSDD